MKGRNKPTDTVTTVAFAGNPNVGKSTLFNSLTGMKQHTGNWPGKTVEVADGYLTCKSKTYHITDLPGTYSLMAHSAEEEIARDFICFDNPDGVVAVCDATCLERNLNLVLQILEITNRVILCINLMDEAEKKNIKIDTKKLSEILKIPVVTTTARNKKSLKRLCEEMEGFTERKNNVIKIEYPEDIENAISIVEKSLENNKTRLPKRWIALRLLEGDAILKEKIFSYLSDTCSLENGLDEANKFLKEKGICREAFKDNIVYSLVSTAEEISGKVVSRETGYGKKERNADKILAGTPFAYPVMLLFLALIFWITIYGANYPSELLSNLFDALGNLLTRFMIYIKLPPIITEILIDGVYRVLSWVVSVMLPPMAIFFPLFSLLEDSGYLPRIAYNLDKPFKKCSACGKQALTMCMGFGCNAAGIIGCRIIDSPRERILAILTNSFVPCNGKFPSLIAIITVFFCGYSSGIIGSVKAALILTLVILAGIFITFPVTKLLSKTVLKGMPSSFILELPPYRKPQIGKTIIRSIADKTIFVLARAVVIAIPAGLIIWILSNINLNGSPLTVHIAAFLDPIGRLMGLDGAILTGFILGFPANEIVLPLIAMIYNGAGTLTETVSLNAMGELFKANGWSFITAGSTILFSLFHWPCSTSLLTVKKETGSMKWTFLAAVIPTLCGVTACIIFATVCRLFVG